VDYSGGNKKSNSILHHPATLPVSHCSDGGIAAFIVLLTRGPSAAWAAGCITSRASLASEARKESLRRSMIRSAPSIAKGKAAFWEASLARGGVDSGALEVAVIFFMIGHRVSLGKRGSSREWRQLAAVVGLFAPAGVGMYEGDIIWRRRSLGSLPLWGVVALIRRVRKIFGTAWGF